VSTDQVTPATQTTTTAPKVVTPAALQRRVTAERIVYGAATLGIAIGPQLDAGPLSALASIGVAAGTGAWLYSKTKDDYDGHTLLHACQRGLSVLTGAGLYAAAVFSPGTSWWELAAPAVWGALMSLWAPITRSAHLAVEAPQQQNPSTPPLGLNPALTLPQPTTYNGFLAHLWQSAAVAPGTQLTAITQYRPDRPDFEAVIVAERGKAVPKLTETALAAAFDFPAGTVTLKPIPHSGPGRMLLTATPTLAPHGHQNPDPMHCMWEEKVSCHGGAAPGMLLTSYRVEDNRIALRVEAPDGQLINLPQKQIARALGMKDASLLMVETDGLGDGIVSVYEKHPLMTVREATAVDLTMDAGGYIQIGLRHDGRPARIPLYDPQMGAVTDLFAGAPGAGKSVTLLTLLAAERISGVVSIVADAQDGMSLPEADGRVYHFGKGVAATAATLAAFNALGQYREKVSAANGWGSFEIGKPWALVNGTFDELNRILAADSIVPSDFRKWVTGLVSDGQSTGRKLGKGIRFAAQSIHLADLGDKDKIRANAKNGTVWLGRVNSSTTQHMAADGVLPSGVTPEPIPRYFKTGSDIDAAFNGEEAKNGPITAGMANIIQGGSLFLARTFYAHKENKTYPGLIALFESAPIPTLTPEEDQVFQQAYAKWLPHAEALLAGEDADGDGGEGYSPVVDPFAAPALPAATGATIKDRILELLADGPMAIKAIRAALPDVASGSVNNTIGQLHDVGLVIPVSRGTYKLADAQPSQSDDNAMEEQLNELLPMAIELVVSTQLGSASMLQRKLRIGWDLANALMQAMELAGIVGPQDGDKNRPVLVNADDLEATLATVRQPQ
jgi:hypothetical protein